MKKTLVLVAIISLTAIAGYFYKYPVFDIDPTDLTEQKEPEDKFRFAVSIDNSQPARPQYGLAKADLVIESPAEASFTRLLAFFQSQDATKIGPVRSARPYFLDWAQGFDSIMVHSGGSTEALLEIATNRNLKNIDEFYNEKFITRDRSKPAPHNLFTSSDKLNERARIDWDVTGLSYGWAEKDDSLSNDIITSQVKIHFNNPVFDVEYQYNSESNIYQRLIGGVVHKDAVTSEELKVKNIVVIETTSTALDEDLLTIDLKTLGSGRAIIFRDGEMVRARWRKVSKSSPLELLDADGTIVQLNRGQTWIEVLDQRHSFSFQ